jgi:sterol desaturase/sphingolipid hydroxylase (fatty acid hydroxylase superfamily)
MIPIELLSSLAIPIAFAIMWALEHPRPARRFAHVDGWARRGVAFFVLVAAIGSIVPIVWNATGLTSLRVLDLSPFGWWGLPVGVVVISGVTYAWHRAEHRVHRIWLATHQLHHSALRVDIPGAFFAHPLEVVAKTTIAVVIGTIVLGLAAPVAAVTTGVLALLSIFQHWNIRTPRWIGWFVPRPEMHCLHHEFGVHARNYGDLPLWDLLFGTFENPEGFEGRVGFEPAASARVSDMLRMRDVNAPASRDATSLAPPLG